MKQDDQIIEKIFRIGRILMLSAIIVTLFTACKKDEDEIENDPSPKSIQTGWWSSPSEDVQFYITQQTKLDTLRITLSFSGNCSGKIIKTIYPIAITDRSFSRDIGSSFDGSTGSIQGTFSSDGKSCSGTYEYNSSCDPISESWTATPD
jgi:hypothetical protein